MARTAPVPNIPAIPGMNPGVWLMGGGGSGGGGSGKGGKGGKAKQGAGGKNGGKDAEGGGKEAGSCGPGSGGGCMNPAHGKNGGTHAGDPVDPVTGRVYTVVQTDMVLTGPLLLEIQRQYSSFSTERDIGLGPGWSHCLAWQLELRRQTMLIHTPSGTTVRRPLPPEGESVAFQSAFRIRRGKNSFILIDNYGLIYQLTPGPDPKTYRLSSILDRAHNRITLSYGPQGLSSLQDSAGRTVEVRRFPDGHIQCFAFISPRGDAIIYRTYEYDSNQDLIAVIDAEGRRTQYRYENHRMTEQVFATGMTVYYRYDEQGRCTESWCSYPGGKDPCLSENVPELLADGITQALGVLHTRFEYYPDFTIAYDSRQAKRFDTNSQGKVDLAAGLWVENLQYDEDGNVISYQNPLGATTVFERDSLGRVTAHIDPSGARTQFRYNDQGDLLETVDALGVASYYSYDQASNLLDVRDSLGELIHYTYDSRGLRTGAVMPGGAQTLFRHDAYGNLIELVEPNQKSRQMKYDEIGRVLSVLNEEGQETRFGYDACGSLRAVYLPGGAMITYSSDEQGRIQKYRGPGGDEYEFLWSGYNVIHEIRKPSGESIRFRYDRECNLVEVINERGEVNTFERDLGGRIIGERRFDGRAYQFTIDIAGNLARVVNGAGEPTDFERDPCGRLIKRTYFDDSADAFAYDPVGRLLRADNPSVQCQFTYDVRGNLIREVQEFAGRSFVVENAYNALGQRTSVRTSVGHNVAFERDAMGNIRKLWLGEDSSVGFQLNAFGRELERELPQGAKIISRLDSQGAPLERKVLGPEAAAQRSSKAQDESSPEATFSETYAYSEGGLLVEHSLAGGARTRYRYDASGRVLERNSSQGGAERYVYEGAGRFYESGEQAPGRIYGPGGALVSRGTVEYQYDKEARRVRRWDCRQGAEQRYEWNGRGQLAAVVLSDGTRVENTYDALGRRVIKRVRRPDETLEETFFLWSGDDVLYELTEAVQDGKRRVLRERAYIFDERYGVPLAQRERKAGQGPWESWAHYLLGPGMVPEALVGDDGKVLGQLRTSLWGAAERSQGKEESPWRFVGQYCDIETGLHYNRYRFYDPEVGLYLNADPIGLAGGLNAFEYAYGQPLRVGDPEGLAPVFCTVKGGGYRGKGASASARTSDPELHPVVAAALPPPVELRDEPFYPAGRRTPDACAEPGALSNYIRDWEKKNNNGKTLDPNNPKDRRKIQKCLGGINSVKAQHADGKARAPCPNCTQLLRNLQDQWGAPKEKHIEPGATSEDGDDCVRGTPPDERWAEGMR